MGLGYKEGSSKNAESSFLLRSLYRQSLLRLGMSPDSHIYDLDYDYLENKNSCWARFLMSVIDFYLELDEVMSKVFIFQILEKDRHYSYWWLSYFKKEEEFKKSLDMTLKKISTHFLA